MESFIVPGLAWALVFGPIAAWYARRRQRAELPWLLFGAILGPLALGLLWAGPPGACPDCGSPVRGWPVTCATCGALLDEWERGVEAVAESTQQDSPQTSVPVPANVRALRRAVDERAGIAGEVGAIRPKSATARGVSVVLEHSPDRPVTVLASGIFTGGSARLEIGARYGLGTVGREFVVLGPADTDPNRIALRHSLRALTVAGIENHVVLSDRSRGRHLVLTFQRLSGMTTLQLEAALSPIGSEQSATRLAPVGPGRDGRDGDEERAVVGAGGADRKTRGGPAA